MDLASAPWTRVAEAAAAQPIVLLPVGAVEAHGPHLPLDTDTRMAVYLAQRVAHALRDRAKLEVLIASPITTTAAAFAADFPGTVCVSAQTEREVVRDTARSLLRAGAHRVVLVNLHFDPEHMRAMRDALADLEAETPGRVVFPNFTRRAHVERIGGEFATGACHGGEFETSLMLVAAPELVAPSHRVLPALDVDLARAIREGKRSFVEVGMRDAYCGHPATATVEEGERLMTALTEIVVEACQRSLPSHGSGPISP